MFRIRWFEPELDDPSMRLEWPVAAPILATLFLNFLFCYVHGVPLWAFGLPFYPLFLGGFLLLVTAAFYIGPALAVHTARRPLLEVIERSVGSIPAMALRFCGALFLLLWIASLMVIPLLSLNHWRATFSTGSGLLAVGILVFLFATGLQSLQTEAKLAMFTNKLAIAIVIAALIRVREGWPAVLDCFQFSGQSSGLSEAWGGFSALAFYVAPLALLAADLGHHGKGRREIVMTGLMGIALPAFGALVLTGVVNAATRASRFYQPSLDPSIGMALWVHAAQSALPGRMMIAAITTFGAVRFAAGALAKIVSIRVPGTRLGWVWLGCLAGVAAWFSLHSYAETFGWACDFTARCLGVTSAVLTGDFLIARRGPEQVKPVDWIGVIAVLTGLIAPLCLPHDPLERSPDPWWHPWLPTSYLLALLVCLCGRWAQKTGIGKRFARPRQERTGRSDYPTFDNEL